MQEVSLHQGPRIKKDAVTGLQPLTKFSERNTQIGHLNQYEERLLKIPKDLVLQHLNEKWVGTCEVEGWVLEGPWEAAGPGQADPRGTEGRRSWPRGRAQRLGRQCPTNERKAKEAQGTAACPLCQAGGWARPGGRGTCRPEGRGLHRALQRHQMHLSSGQDLRDQLVSISLRKTRRSSPKEMCRAQAETAPEAPAQAQVRRDGQVGKMMPTPAP